MAAWRPPDQNNYPRTRLGDTRLTDYVPITVVLVVAFCVVFFNLHV